MAPGLVQRAGDRWDHWRLARDAPLPPLVGRRHRTPTGMNSPDRRAQIANAIQSTQTAVGRLIASCARLWLRLGIMSPAKHRLLTYVIMPLALIFLMFPLGLLGTSGYVLASVLISAVLVV